jgi:hypothetical protein
MKLKVKRLVEVEPVAIECQLAVRYEEEDIPNDFPLRQGEMWIGTIDIETGVIRDWPTGKSGSMFMKVCDEGTYTLLGKSETLAVRENNYVPSCIPGEYGDYVNFDIDENGKIARWFEYCSKDRIAESFFED